MQGFTTAIADAIVERDLETLGDVAVEMGISTGASGLGLGLARALVKSGQVPLQTGTTDGAMRPVGGLAAIVAGSCSRATLEQLEIAERSMPVLRLDSEKLIAGSDEIAAALSWAGERISAGPVAIAASASPETVSSSNRDTDVRHRAMRSRLQRRQSRPNSWQRAYGVWSSQAAKPQAQ